MTKVLGRFTRMSLGCGIGHSVITDDGRFRVVPARMRQVKGEDVNTSR